jgi:Apea-like HEPN
MNDAGASATLIAVATGDDSKLDQLLPWLYVRDGIAGRYLSGDLRDAVRSMARPGGDGGLSALLRELTERPESVLAAFFESTKAPGVFELPGALIGPAGEVAARAPSASGLSAWRDDDETLAVLARHPAQGRLGAIRTAAWLQTVLGAIGLTAYWQTRTLAPFALCPALGTALFLSTASGKPDPIHQAALLAPGPPPASQLAELMTASEPRELLLDATALTPRDLAQHRLTLAARWLQLASSAISAADALVALGIALETITGDEDKGQVVEKIAKRAAIFLAAGAPAEQRNDVFYDELKRAKKLYELRSRATHGQFDEWAGDQAKSDAGREEFHRFVLDVTLGFREFARDRNFRGIDDFMNWWKRGELHGFF